MREQDEYIGETETCVADTGIVETNFESEREENPARAEQAGGKTCAADTGIAEPDFESEREKNSARAKQAGGKTCAADTEIAETDFESEREENSARAADTAAPELQKKKIFQKFQVKDIVFLAILSAVTLVTCAVMPLVTGLQTVVFGIAQVVTGLQISVFFAIGLMKVRKPGALLFMALLTGVIQLLMAPPMFFSNVLNGLLLEVLIAVIFRGYQKNIAVFLAVALYNPLSLPFNYLYNLAVGKEAVTAVAQNAPWAAVGMTIAVVVISVLGTLIGMKIAKELKKSGALKK